MDVDEQLREIGAGYASRVPRHGVAAVEALRRAGEITVPRQTIVVVGTNGKTSTATYLARLLAAQGVRTGLTTSPHLRRWGERVQLDGQPVADEELARQVGRLDDLARRQPEREQLRFFDLVTLAAAGIFERAGVEAAVFEAGIGGRLDATRVLAPPLVVLTSVSLDHTELLGDSEGAILREKLGVAPPGARVVAAPLAPSLAEEARSVAAANRLDLSFAQVAGGYRERNLQLAAAALGVRDARVDLDLPGRLQRAVVDGVEVVLDAAHNPEGWATLAEELDEPFVAVVSIGADRSATALAPVLARAVATFATSAWPGRSRPAEELAAELGAEAVDDPALATRLGLERARATGLPLVVFGSTYLLPHALDALEL